MKFNPNRYKLDIYRFYLQEKICATFVKYGIKKCNVFLRNLHNKINISVVGYVST